MKIAFLPYWCKYIALVLLAASLLLSIDFFFTSFKAGYEAGRKGLSFSENIAEFQQLIASYPAGKQARVLTSDLMQLLAIALYVLSKDRRDDEYLQAMRAQSFMLAMLACFAGCLLLYAFGKPTDGLSVLTVQFILYLIIFKIRKSLPSYAGGDGGDGGIAT